MHRKIAQLLRLPALALAAALQIMPIARAALPVAQTTANVLAIIFRWGAGVAAALGGIQAVSGASTVITSPLSTNIVQGKPFVMRLTTAPEQAGYWSASGLPAGIALVGSSGSSFWQLSGTPTVTGTYIVGLTAKSSASAGASQSTTANLTINISPGVVIAPPAITGQPSSLVVTQGQPAAFSVTATGTTPLTYFWRKGGSPITNGPNPSLIIPNTQPADAGTYSVIVSNSAGTVTSSNATLTVVALPTAPTITTQPGNLSVLVGQTATFNVTATGTAPLRYLWFKGATILTNSANSSFAIANAQIADAGTYSVIVSNSIGTATSSNATLTVNAVGVAPAITVQPTNQSVYQGNNVFLFVGATGTGPLSYQWRKNGVNLANSAHLSGAQSNLFTINSALTTDSGRYSVVITNNAGSITSQVAVVIVTNAAVLTVQIIGSGSVSPDYNGQSLVIGSNYTVTATAGSGYLFAKWTGSIFSTADALTFVMQPGLILQANFVTSPFPQLAGTYSGIFYGTNALNQLSSGAVTITEKNSGAFTGTLQIGSSKWPFTGQFDGTGNASVAVSRGKMNPLTLALQLDLFGGSDRIAGTVTVSDNSWTSELAAVRTGGFNTTTNPCPQAGTYTLVIPGTPGSTQKPAGDGYGLVKVSTAGQVTLTGVLADGTRVSQTATLSQSSDWVVYVPLYVGRGYFLGWLTFTNAPDRDMDGWVGWFRPVQPSVALYTMGFAVMTEAVGSRYAKPPTGTPALSFTDGMVILSDGNLSAGFTNQVQLNANNTVVNLSNNSLKLAINPGNGLFSGSAQDPVSRKNLSFKGVVLQKQNAAGGYFLNQNQSGEVYLGQ
jgi:hypothetical protein